MVVFCGGFAPVLSYGLSTTFTSKSRFAGSVSPMRISPLLSTRLYAAWRWASVATGAFGPFAPSFSRKSGSRPWVALNTACICGGVIVMAADGW